MLNAFRHRRSVRTSSGMMKSAVPRAQRLSASEIGAVGIEIRLYAGVRVLNAFRHRRSVRSPICVGNL
ncbi:conserved uncharacterized protein [Desulfococcus multivorans]|nr:conserved uncharacterized protein [Desulfococcus multivorans]